MTTASTAPTLVVVGLGPRGVICLERLVALLPCSGLERLVLHLVEEHEPGAGKVWATDQHRELCMNTLAGAVTLFTDDSHTGPRPLLAGPSLFQWCVSVAPSVEAVRRGGYEAELAAIRPESHPSRALYGEYLVWCWQKALASVPDTVELTVHRARATAVTEAEGRTVVELSTGERVAADAVVLTTGWLDVAPGDSDASLAESADAAGLTWVRPDSPILQDVACVPAGEDVIVRGLGMGFFDTMALLTIGRGGRFVPSSEPGGLTYEPSGAEPVLHVGSRRGVPYRAKSLYGGLPPAATLEHLRGEDWDAVPRPVDYRRRVWPLVVRDAYTAYYRTLWAEKPAALPHGLDPVLTAVAAAGPDTIDQAVAGYVPELADRFDLARLADPAHGTYDSAADFDAFVANYLADDLAEAELGTHSPLKAGLWAVSAARRFVIQLLSFDASDADSHAGLGEMLAFGGMVGSGPPAFRNRQLLALHRAGLVHFVGPSTRVDVEDGAFVARSRSVAGSEVRSRTLVDAWMRNHDVARTADPLVASLLRAGRARPYRRLGSDGTPRAGVSPDIDPLTSRLVRADGTLDVVHLVGIPVDDARGDGVISPMPGTNPTMLLDTANATASALALLAAARTDREDRS